MKLKRRAEEYEKRDMARATHVGEFHFERVELEEGGGEQQHEVPGQRDGAGNDVIRIGRHVIMTSSART